LGESFYTCANPKVATTFTIHLRDDIKTIRELRREREKELIKTNQPVPYPPADSIRLEDNQSDPYLLLTIRDADGNPVRKLKAEAKKGLKRIHWDMRYSSPAPVSFYTPDPNNPWDQSETGAMAVPGTYSVTLSKVHNGTLTELAGPETFSIRPLRLNKLSPEDKRAFDAFCRNVAELRRNAGIANEHRSELENKLKYLRAALLETPGAGAELVQDLEKIRQRLQALNMLMNGDGSMARREFETTPSLNDRIGTIEGGMWSTTSNPTGTYRKSYTTAEKQLREAVTSLGEIAASIAVFESRMDTLKAPWTPGRKPTIK
ncbi:MAG: glycosyl hydrolase, partial [Bacteroidota bacterium]